MKAEYILKAIDAMRNAEKVLLHDWTNTTLTFNAYKELSDARVALLIYSGVRDLEITVEDDAA